MTKKRLSKSDIKGLNERLVPFGIELSKKEVVEIFNNEEGTFYLVNGTPCFFVLDEGLVPHLKLLQERPSLLKHVTVDMGAVKFVTNGADVMRPGITKVEDDIEEGEFVAIVEETHGKPLAVGKALLSSEEMSVASEGKVVASIHFVGDKIWNGKF